MLNNFFNTLNGYIYICLNCVHIKRLVPLLKSFFNNESLIHSPLRLRKTLYSKSKYN